MAPPWFDTQNYWATHGAVLLGSKQGALTTLTQLQNAFIEVPIGPRDHVQYVGAAAINGDSTEPMEHMGPRAPAAYIAGGYYLSGEYFRAGFQHGLALTTNFWGTNNGTVNLVTGPPEVPEEFAIPPYRAEMLFDNIRMGMSIQGGGIWADGRPMWIGEYYMELYLYSKGTDPAYTPNLGYGGDASQDTDPVTCPPRPEWPYREPIAMVGNGGPARIRRSRP